MFQRIRLLLCGLFFLWLASACGTQPAATPVPSPSPAATVDLPSITGVSLDRQEVPRYESLEITVALRAEYTNPYDARQVRLEGRFIAPDERQMTVPGFWDGETAWRVRFTPWQEGTWRYQLTVADRHGISAPAEGTFMVTPSDLHGWLQVGAWVNPAYSPHYLVYRDGMPFYGTGFCEALNILIDRFDAENGVLLFDNMKAAGADYVVWWPLYTNSPVSGRYDQYNVANLKMIDTIVADAQKEGIFLIFTIWDHPELRAKGHPWGNGNWERNGFSQLSDIDDFFTSEEAWAWQENLYRYVIARWSYSPAIGMWQTVSEINGTNAGAQTNSWHSRVNAYFAQHDPYRHPTTASMSGDVDWPEGHQVMDVLQVHLYDFHNGELQGDAVKAAEILARWTARMWQRADKPNWVGEFGMPGNSYYPELFHNALWAALATGAALTPAEWNSGGVWGRPTPEMYADIHRLARFVADIPLAQWNPAPLQIVSHDPHVRGWGLAGTQGGLFWVQDFSLEGQPLETVRQGLSVRHNVELEVQGLAEGTYQVSPYDTWQGVSLPAFEISCLAEQPCRIVLPDFKADMAFRLERK